jgi:hypothetical protein
LVIMPAGSTEISPRRAADGSRNHGLNPASSS